MIEAIDNLRRLVPDLDRAWYAAQVDETQEDEGKAHLYRAADALAGDAIVTLTALAREAEDDIVALDLDPDDRQDLRLPQHREHPAVSFYLECHEAIATFRYWGAEGDFAPTLDRVSLAATKWLHAQPERSEAAAQVSAAKAEAAVAKMAVNAHRAPLRVANDKSKSKAQRRAEAAREAAGTSDLLSAACSGPNGALAAVYGYTNADEFMADAKDNSHRLRKQLERDSKRLS